MASAPIAIYERCGSYSDRWIEYCKGNDLPYILVDIYCSSVLQTLRQHNVCALLAHPPMASAATSLAARSVLFSVEAAGITVFPGFSEFWHFDDKVAQKFLFESLGIAHPTMHVFFSKKHAFDWIESVESWPKVFKLRCGAGSHNVKLVRDSSSARKLARVMFGTGMNANDAAIRDLGGKLQRHRKNKDWMSVLGRLPKTLGTLVEKRRELQREKGYILFQDFVPGNDCDIRINVVGDVAFGFVRHVRDGDFRASGSGSIDFDWRSIPQSVVRTAFDAASRMRTRCIAIDFVVDHASGAPLVVEVSFGFKSEVAAQCTGYWTRDMAFHQAEIRPEWLIAVAVVGNACGQS